MTICVKLFKINFLGTEKQIKQEVGSIFQLTDESEISKSLGSFILFKDLVK